ncbi:MAG: TldD/PmbA family protein [Acidimicrobiales bacterium]
MTPHEDRELLLDTCRRVLDIVGARAEAEVTVSSHRSALTRFANSFIHQNVADIGWSCRLKVVVDGRLATASTSRVQTGLRDLVERALEAARLRPVDPGWPGVSPPRRVEGTGNYDEATHVASPEARAAIVRDFVDQGDQTIAAGFCETGGREVAFANSGGHELWGRTTKAVIEGIHRTLHADGGGRQIAARVGDLDGAATGRIAAEKARASDDPVDVDPGEWEVILEPNCVVDMLDFLTGHGFNAKEVAEGQSFVQLGEAQFDPSISIFDDATDDRAIGLPFDAEGTPRRRLDLVTAGVSTAVAYDRRTAKPAGVESTGHAVPSGEISGPFPSHVFLEPGIRPPSELIASVRRGLLVSDFWYTRILDPKTQVVTGLTRNGTFLIEDGRVTRPVRNLRFTQSYVEALAPGNVLGVADDGRLAGEDQYFAPTLHLASWNFSGGAKG